jgi:hypothetical protein
MSLSAVPKKCSGYEGTRDYSGRLINRVDCNKCLYCFHKDDVAFGKTMFDSKCRKLTGKELSNVFNTYDDDLIKLRPPTDPIFSVGSKSVWYTYEKDGCCDPKYKHSCDIVVFCYFSGNDFRFIRYHRSFEDGASWTCDEDYFGDNTVFVVPEANTETIKRVCLAYTDVLQQLHELKKTVADINYRLSHVSGGSRDD